MTSPTPHPLRAALERLADEADRFRGSHGNGDLTTAQIYALLAAHPEPEREAGAEVAGVTPDLLRQEANRRHQSGYLHYATVRNLMRKLADHMDAMSTFGSGHDARIVAASVHVPGMPCTKCPPGEHSPLRHGRLAPPVAHQDTEREWHDPGDDPEDCPWDGSEDDMEFCTCGPPAPPVPETDEAAATLAEVEKLFRGTFFGDFGGHDWRGGDATVQEFARDLGRLLHDYRKQADR